MIKNHRAILRSHIGALPVQGGRVMVRPKNIQKFVIADLRRIELHLHHLGVRSLIRTNILIRRILFPSACITDGRGQDALQIAESFFHSPETTCAECGFLRLHVKTMMRLRVMRNPTLLENSWGDAPGSPRRIRPMADWFEIAPSALTVLHGGKDRQMRRILAVVCAVLTAAGVDPARESAETADTTALARRFGVEDFVEDHSLLDSRLCVSFA